MNITQITETLVKLFDDYRIVFWNDEEGEFLENLATLIPENVALLRADETGALAAKIQLEIDEPEKKFLVYSPVPEPTFEDDWLLDVRLYSRVFTADAASLLLNELGLNQQTLRAFLQTRKPFFSDKERLSKLKSLVAPEDGERELDRKMLAVAVRAEQPETFSILMKMIGEYANELRADDEGKNLRPKQPAAWSKIEKFNLSDYLRRSVGETFGYENENFNFYDLLVRLFVTDFAANLRGKEPGNALTTLNLLQVGSDKSVANRTGAYNASVFLANWRTSTTYFEDYKFFASRIGEEINIDEQLRDFTAFDLAGSETFEAIERRTVSDLRDRLLAPLPSDTAEWQNLINARRDRFWSRDGGTDNPYRAAYDALLSMLGFLRLKDKYRDGFGFTDAASVFNSYTTELFSFDQYYRLFMEAARRVKFAGWSLLNPLSAELEKLYGNWFLEKLATGWGICIENESLFERWQIERVPNQYRFYDKFVKPLVQETADRKIYVIISDAFRYECAEELTRELNSEARRSGQGMLKADLSVQLGVVPSYTALGMASLLPHEILDYKELNPNADVLLADGNSTAGLDNRAAVLGRVNGTAVRADEFIKLGKDAGREAVRDYRVVYIYHNVVDATGDSASTEGETFKAVRQTIADLKSHINFIFNSLNGSQVFITADHGFLYQENAPETLDRSALEIKSDQVLKRKKRYVINPQIEEQENAWRGSIGKTAKISGEMQFLIPKGANRFYFSGGARFVHGGAMPQEIAVPLITVIKLRGKTAERSSISQVGVTLLGNLTRIVNNVQRFEFIQTEKVSERVLPRTLKISLRDDQNKIISNEETVTFDSGSDSMDDRRKNVRLTLRAGSYDRTKSYYLAAIDEAAVVKEYMRLTVTIDIAFSSDF